MNKNALLDYALFARRELETQIALSLNNLGITKDGVANVKRVGDVYAIDGIQDSISQRVYELRKRIIDSHINNAKFEDVVEEFAYTWFNRIVAIRFMEVHDYFPHGFRVLSSRDGSYEPEILKNLPFVAAELKLDEKRVTTYQEQNRLEDLYRYVLVQQCNALKDIIPMLFEEQGAYLELLLPSNLLSQDSIIRRIEDIPEEDFLNDIEIVGWLYQFYNSVKKDEVFASKKKITKETLPAVTQLFTPDWIVRYMAENSIGRIWMESYPNSPMKSEMKYYVDDAEQTEEVQKKIDEIKYKNVKPEDIRIIEPCCGSGHILVYAFDLLNQMYLEKGYEKREIPGLILKNNLYGLDVDKRAAQLAQFALIMKARSIDNRFFNEGRYVLPKVYEILDSQAIEGDYRNHMKTLKFSKESIDIAGYLEKTFKEGKTIGSLLNIEERDYESFISEIDQVKSGDIPGLFEQIFFNYGLDILKQLAVLATVLSSKYSVMVTNPPYVNASKFDAPLKEYASKQYRDSRTDMFSMFIEKSFNVTEHGGFASFMAPYVWMFIKSYEELRSHVIHGKQIITLAQLEYSALEEATVPLCTFTLRNYPPYTNGCFFRLTDFRGGMSVQAEKFLMINSKKGNYYYETTATDFLDIPGKPFAYWLSKNYINAFSAGEALSDKGNTCQGMATTNNNKFLRQWFEVSFNKIGIGLESEEDTIGSFKWFPYNKGGDFRKWYGNIDYVVNFANKGDEVCKYIDSHSAVNHTGRVINRDKYFKACLSWSKISSGSIAFRYYPNGFIFDVAGCSIFYADKNTMFYDFGFINSIVSKSILTAISPTLNFETGHVSSLPIIRSKEMMDEIIRITHSNVELAKKDWDSFETSWDFEIHAIIENALRNNGDSLISECFNQWELDAKQRFSTLKENEEELNKIFIDVYDLEKELSPIVEDKDISVRSADMNRDIKSLISYLVGLVMGRYSLDKKGIAFAGDKWHEGYYKTYSPDEDGIIPIYQYIGIEDGLLNNICDLVKNTFGESLYKENIDFLAKNLGQKPSESSEEAINRYLNESFFSDHIQVYQKRPIYWMLSSGKQGAFKCLIYLHRYNKNTLATVNTKYFLPRTAMYKAERERLQARLDSGTLDAREKKNVEAELKNIEKCEEELLEYGQVLDYLANQYIELDLDDGVKENYLKFQRIPLEVNGARVKKDLLVPFGLEKDKK